MYVKTPLEVIFKSIYLKNVFVLNKLSHKHPGKVKLNLKKNFLL